MAVVAFSSTAFIAQYPIFTGIGVPQLTSAFGQASYFCNNTDSSIVTDTVERTTLLYLLTAHVTQLLYGTNDGVNPPQAPTGAVGRVESAQEGTVHVKLDMGVTSAGSAWYKQTTYGAMYWALTMKYRSFNYVASQRNCTNTVGVGLGLVLTPPISGGGNGIGFP